MSPPADYAGVKLVANIEAAIPLSAIADARQEAYNRLAQIAIGKQFQAEVLSRLNDGTFLVRVADTVARMNLPPGTAPGNSVDLTFIGSEPRPTFVLGRQSEGQTVTINQSGQEVERFLQMAGGQEPAAAAPGKPPLPAVAESVASKANLADLTQTELGTAALAAFSRTPLGKEALAALAATPLGREALASRAATPPGAGLAEPEVTLADLAESTAGKAALRDFGETAIGKATLMAIAGTEIGKAALADIGAAALAKLGLPAAPQPHPAAAATGASAPTSLSQTGRLINQILRSATQEGAPTAIVGRTPLVQVPGAAVPHLTTQLKDALTFSGLFYESHVAQWAEGKRAITDLMREPQAALRNRPAGPGAPQPGVPQPELQIENPPPAATSLLGGQPHNSSSPPGEFDKTLASALNPNAANLINLQLNALENNRVLWQGELFPGQPMEWEVSRDAPERGHDPDSQAWKSSVRFELPILGAVTADIHLSGEHVRVQVRTASDAAAAVLREHGSEFASALQAAGAALDQLTVNSDGKA